MMSTSRQVLNIIILEDSKERLQKFDKNLPSHTLTWTDNAYQCIELLKVGSYDVLFLDYDLGSDHYTGYDVACWLELHQEKKPGLIVIHSLNPIGAKRMQYALPESHYVPGIWDKSDLLGLLKHFKKS